MKIDLTKTLRNIENSFNILFENIKVIEGTDKVYYNMSGYKSKMLSNIEMNIIIEKSNIGNNIKWSYLTNPKRKLVCEKISLSNRLINDIIKTMDYMEFDEKYLETVQIIKENVKYELSKDQINHMNWLRESFNMSVASSNSSAGSSGRKLSLLRGIDNDIIDINLIVY